MKDGSGTRPRTRGGPCGCGGYRRGHRVRGVKSGRGRMPARLSVPRRANERSTASAGGVRVGRGTRPARGRPRRQRRDLWRSRALSPRPVEQTTGHRAVMTRQASLTEARSGRLNSFRWHRIRDAPSAADRFGRESRARGSAQAIEHQRAGDLHRLRAPRVGYSPLGLLTGSTRTPPQAATIPKLKRPNAGGSHASSRLPAPIRREKVSEVCRPKMGSDETLATERLRHSLNLSKLTPSCQNRNNESANSGPRILPSRRCRVRHRSGHVCAGMRFGGGRTCHTGVHAELARGTPRARIGLDRLAQCPWADDAITRLDRGQTA
jgi:hypothetical protein